MIKAVIASGLYSDVQEYLKSRGVEILTFSDNMDVDPRVAHHTDLSFFFDGNDTLFVVSEFAEYEKTLNKYCKSIVFINKKLGKKYPEDVLLNCVCVGNHFICNKNAVASEVFDKMKNSGYNIINVKQGYTKCSVIPVSENAMITDDESICNECIKAGIDVLKVTKGSVVLDGFDYGFIGGTAGKISENEILFNGNITEHADFAEIDLFLKKYGVKAVCFGGQLKDIGSIIPIGGN